MNFYLNSYNTLLSHRTVCVCECVISDLVMSIRVPPAVERAKYEEKSLVVDWSKD